MKKKNVAPKKPSSNRKDLAIAAQDYTPENDFDVGSKHVDLSGPTTEISIRLPEKMLAVLSGFAERNGTDYQSLIRAWLDDRIRTEALSLLKVAL